MKITEKVRFKNDGPIGILTFDNPKNLNGLDFQVMEEVNILLDHMQSEGTTRCLILTGAGEKAFIAGGDIAMQLTFTVSMANTWAMLGYRTLRRLETLSIPVIGAVNGYALGGGTEIALTCDMLIASEKAVFAQPEITLGIIPGYGGTQRLARKIGVNKAKEFILLGRRFDAWEAKEIGLVNTVVPHERLMEEAMKWANVAAALSPDALLFAKQAINDGLQCDIDRGLTVERGLFVQCFDTERQKIEMRNFVEKRDKPKN